MNGSVSPNGQWLAGITDDDDHHFVTVNLNDFSVISCMNLEDYYKEVERVSEYNEWLWSEDSTQLFIIINARTQCDLWQYDFNLKQVRLISRQSNDFLRAASNDDWVFENYPGGKSIGEGQSSLVRFNPLTQQKVVLAKTSDTDQQVAMNDYKNGYIVATRGPINEVEASDIILYSPQNEEHVLGQGYFPLFRKDTDEVVYISQDPKTLVSHNIKTSAEHTLVTFPKPLRAAYPYYWIDANSIVVLNTPTLILEINSEYII